MTRCLLVVVLLLVPRAVHAEDRLFRVSMVAAMAAHGADLGSTEFCLGSGRCTESNPFLARFDQPAVFGAVKMSIAAAQLWGMAKLHETHPKWATAINFGTAAVFTGIAIRNTRVSR